MVRLDGDVCDRRLLSMQQDTARAQKQHRIRSRITISRCQSARVDVRQSEERQQRDTAVEEDGRCRVSKRRHRCGGSYRAPAPQQERNILEVGEEPIQAESGSIVKDEDKTCLPLKALTIQTKHT